MGVVSPTTVRILAQFPVAFLRAPTSLLVLLPEELDSVRVDIRIDGPPSRSDGVVGGDVRVLVRVRRGRSVQVVYCRAGSGSRRGGENGTASDVGLHHSLTVPAAAFAVDPAAGHFSVHFAGPFEAVRQSVLLDSVVVVDEVADAFLAGFEEAVVVVAGRGELVRMPR